MMSATFRLSLSLLRRDWRAGEWRILLLALLLAVGSLATVGLFADRVRQALQQDAQSLIGADLRLSSTRELPESYRQAAIQHGLKTVLSLSFPSMVSTSAQSLLSEIQAVEIGYPLRGKIEIDDGKIHLAEAIPNSGDVWLDARLLRRLKLKIGDQVAVGKRYFHVSALIVKDIDQAIGFASFAPRLLMNADDLASTGLQQEGSRILFRLMVAGDAKQILALRAALKPQLSHSEKLEDVRDARPEIRSALERAESFLGLAALTTAILAGAAMALAARRFVLRHLDSCAVMRCLGAQQNQLLWLYFLQLLFIGLLALLLGCGLGFLTQAALVEWIPALREASLPSPSGLPALKAALSGLALLFGFTFVPLLQLREVSPLRVLRRELGAPSSRTGLGYFLASSVLIALFIWQAATAKLGLVVLGGLLVGLLVVAGLVKIMLRLLVIVGKRFQLTRHALNNLSRHGNHSTLQVLALSFGGMALLLLTLVRADLFDSWQSKLPFDAPNRFMVNIQPDQQTALADFFQQQNLRLPSLQPMIRGRLIALNDRPITGETYTDQRAKALVEREFNLSFMADMPSWNETVQGNWWRKGEGGQLSVEEGLAKTLGIQLNDRLSYDVAGTVFTARVSHLRKVQWDSMRVNFFVITSPDVLQDFPASYLSSFYLPPAKVSVGDQLSREFPNLLLIDTGAVITQVRGIMAQISQTMSLVFLFTLACGLVVLYAALLASQDERIQEAAILRTLGADTRYLLRLHLSEFAILGGISGLFAVAGAVLLGALLARYVLEIDYHSGGTVWLLGIGGGMTLVMLAGWLAVRRLASWSPLRILTAD